MTRDGRGKRGACGVWEALQSEAGFLGEVPGGQVLPSPVLENQGHGITQASDPLLSELAPPTPSLISPLQFILHTGASALSEEKD
jgi:hypothetical protein